MLDSVKKLSANFIFLAFFVSLWGEPPREIPPEHYLEYTLQGRVPVHKWYQDDSYPPEKPIVFKTEEIDRYIEQILQGQTAYYGHTDAYLYRLLNAYPIRGKRVAIIGTVIPWYESIVLAYGGFPTTIEYNKIVSEDPRIEVFTVEEYWQNPKRFDAIFCISSIEHDGLGRYGDPINPKGDLETMAKFKKMLSDGGVLFLSIPVGQDKLYWNVHRRYGKLRLPMLFEGWELLKSAGFSQSDFSIREYNGHQPVFLLAPSGS